MFEDDDRLTDSGLKEFNVRFKEFCNVFNTRHSIMDATTANKWTEQAALPFIEKMCKFNLSLHMTAANVWLPPCMLLKILLEDTAQLDRWCICRCTANVSIVQKVVDVPIIH